MAAAERLGALCAILADCGREREAASLAASSCAVRCAAAAAMLRRRHPLEALQQEPSRWRRGVIAFGVLRGLLPPLRIAPYVDSEQFVRAYPNWRTKLLPARQAGGGARFTFNMVQRVPVRADRPPAPAAKGGELALFRFIAFPTPAAAVAFFETWAQLQAHRLSGQRSTCLMECGPADPATPRKWIMDIDAKLEDLAAFGLLLRPSACTEPDREALHDAVIAYGAAVAAALHQVLGATSRPCHYAVKSRHQACPGGGYRKLSWHITFCAAAPYAGLRRAFVQAEKLACPPAILEARAARTPIPDHLRGSPWMPAVLSDNHIASNSKGQFMQTLHSEKVEAGAQATAVRFAMCGVYGPGGRPVPLPPADAESLSFAATSLALIDPWCVELIPPAEEPAAAPRLKPSVRRPRAVRPRTDTGSKPAEAEEEEDDGLLRFSGLASWARLPASHGWMRELLCDPGGATGLAEIPSMNTGTYLPSYVITTINSGGGEVVFYAHVTSPRLCPRHMSYAKLDTNAVHHHHTNNMMAVCMRQHNEASRLRRAGLEAPFEEFRLFALCFSQKCRCLTPSDAPFGQWVELSRKHHNRLLRLTTASRPL